MRRKICNIGNSRGVSIPVDVLEALHLDVGAEVDVKLDDSKSKIIMEPARKKKYPEGIDKEFVSQVNEFIAKYEPALKALAKKENTLGLFRDLISNSVFLSMPFTMWLRLFCGTILLRIDSMHIDNYAFGKIVIDGKTYTSDVIVYPDSVDPSWWRKEGHYLQKEDLNDILKAGPDIVIIGRGNWGVMEVPKATLDFLESKGIKAYAEKTAKAVELFNAQPKDKKVIGAFHLTC